MTATRERKAVCPWCEKLLTPYVPKGGDGSASFFRSHKDREGRDCNGWAAMVQPEDYPEPAPSVSGADNGDNQ